ncbi:MAG: glycosyltransferase [Pseudoalteromonas sp.]
MVNNLTQEEITSHWKYTDRVYISCICPAYNQEKFIAKTIESFLFQVTEYKFEIIIHDDKSTDSTLNIIKEFKNEYPKLIKVIENTENQFSIEPSRPILNLLSKAQGEYICICEGDDYWISNTKIHEQYIYMENNKSCSMHVFDAQIVDESDQLICSSKQKKHRIKSGEYNKERMNETFIFLTLCTMFRKKDVLPYPKSFLKLINMDSILQVLLSYKGNAYVDNKVCCVYRVTSKGVWSKTNSEFKMHSDITKLLELKRFYKRNGDLQLSHNASVSIIFKLIKNIGLKYLILTVINKVIMKVKS